MSNRAHRRPQRRRSRFDRTKALQAAAVGAYIRGCTCDFDVTVKHDDPNLDGRITIGHDDDCPALTTTGLSFTLMPRRDQ